MEEENYQKELFEFEKPKRSFPRLANLFPKPDFERNISVTISLERLIFISIGIIMVMIIVYALGVETGKGRSRHYRIAAKAQPAKMVVVQSQAALPPRTAEALKPRPYTINAGSYARKEGALQAYNRLKKDGLDVSIVQSDSHYQVRIGSYADKNSPQALKDLKSVQRLYGDAYFKLR